MQHKNVLGSIFTFQKLLIKCLFEGLITEIIRNHYIEKLELATLVKNAFLK